MQQYPASSHKSTQDLLSIYDKQLAVGLVAGFEQRFTVQNMLPDSKTSES
jgi:hypothetical protein